MTEFEFIDDRFIGRGFARQQQQARQFLGQPAEEAPIFSLTDTVAAPFRGAARGIANIFDTLTFDAVDIFPEDGPFGRSNTLVGGFLDGISQFLAGFAVPFWWLGRGAQIGRIGVKALKGTAAKNFARGTIAGAAADFGAFDAQEARLSNMLREIGGLRDPVTEYLAAQIDDGELEGRLKNVLEGAVVGSALAGVVGGLRRGLAGIREMRRGLAEQLPPDEIVRRMEAVAPESEMRETLSTLHEASRDQDSRRLGHPQPEKMFQRTGELVDGKEVRRAVVEGRTVDVARIEMPGKKPAWFEIKDGKPVGEPLGGTLDTASIEALKRTQHALTVERITGRPPTTAELIDLGRREPNPDREFFSDPEQLNDFVRRVKETRERPPEETRLGESPKRMHSVDLIERELEKEDLNLMNISQDEAVITRTVEDLLQDTRLRAAREPVPNVEVARRSLRAFADMNDMDHQSLVTLADERLADAEEAMIVAKALEMIHKNQTRVAAKLIDRAQRALAGTDELEKARAINDYATHMARSLALQERMTRFSALAGRTLQSKRIPFMTAQEMEGFLRQRGDQTKLAEHLGKMRALIEDGGRITENNAASFWRYAREAHRAGFGSMATELWLNSLLWGGRTMAINGLSGAMMAVWTPFERMIGGLATFQPDVVRQGMNQVVGLVEGLRESWQFAKEAFKDPHGAWKKTGRGAEPGLAQRGQAITGENVGALVGANLQNDTGAGKLITWMGNIHTGATRILAATDQLIGGAIQRASLKSQLMEEAMEAGMRPHEAATFIKEQMDILIHRGNAFSRDSVASLGRERGLSEGLEGAELDDFVKGFTIRNFDENPRRHMLQALTEEAQRQREDALFTRRLRRREEGTVGSIETATAGIQDVVTSHPFLRLFLPFMQTPFNIQLAATDRTLGLFTGTARILAAKMLKIPSAQRHLKTTNSRLVQDIFAEGTDATTTRIAMQRRADAMGRALTGSSLMMTFAVLAHNGQLTGSGPADAEQRRLLEQAGWLPYSIKVPEAMGGGYLQYLRFDPFATMAGFMADYLTMGKWARVEDQDDVETFGNAVLTALTENITNKSYMTGLRTLFEMASEPERYLQTGAQRLGGGFVPTLPAQLASSAISGGGPPSDPMLREVQSIRDAVMAKIPYFGTSLDPVRNILGEPVKRRRTFAGEDPVSAVLDLFLPTAYVETSDDLIFEELSSLKHAFRLPRAKLGAVDLRDFRRDSGQSAFDRMVQLRQSISLNGKTLRRALRELFRSREYQALSPENTLEAPSPRINAIQRVVGIFHRAAQRQMYREFPEAFAAVQRQRRQRLIARRGL